MSQLWTPETDQAEKRRPKANIAAGRERAQQRIRTQVVLQKKRGPYKKLSA